MDNEDCDGYCKRPVHEDEEKAADVEETMIDDEEMQITSARDEGNDRGIEEERKEEEKREETRCERATSK